MIFGETTLFVDFINARFSLGSIYHFTVSSTHKTYEILGIFKNSYLGYLDTICRSPLKLFWLK